MVILLCPVGYKVVNFYSLILMSFLAPFPFYGINFYTDLPIEDELHKMVYYDLINLLRLQNSISTPCN